MLRGVGEMAWLIWIWRKIMVMRGSRAGDIRVIGLVAGTHVIEDIGRGAAWGASGNTGAFGGPI